MCICICKCMIYICIYLHCICMAPDSSPSVTITYMSTFICPHLYARIKLLVLTCKQWDYFIAYLYDSNFVTRSMESLFPKSGTRPHA